MRTLFNKLANVFLQSQELQEAAITFKQPNADIQQIYNSGVKFILSYYGAKAYNIDLNEFRYLCFYKSLTKKTS